MNDIQMAHTNALTSLDNDKYMILSSNNFYKSKVGASWLLVVVGSSVDFLSII